ncbi:MAG TPA: nuclear transport factor 2 family protein [Chthoniobacterales bacterium]|nr:nuclear transport factor 2 family protein [Chthoniobacterales bacterium]
MNNQFESTYASLVRWDERSRETSRGLNSFGGIAKRLGTLAVGLALLISTTAPVRADDALTARNKALVRDFYTTVLIGHDVDAAPRFMRPDYIQHNPQVPTGMKGFMDTFRERFAQKFPPDYKRELLNVIGDNEMVVVYQRQTWTGKDGQHHQALGFDMFRVQDGMIAEHWDAD